jgi:hypothetical protein
MAERWIERSALFFPQSCRLCCKNNAASWECLCCHHPTQTVLARQKLALQTLCYVVGIPKICDISLFLHSYVCLNHVVDAAGLQPAVRILVQHRFYIAPNALRFLDDILVAALLEQIIILIQHVQSLLINLKMHQSLCQKYRDAWQPRDRHAFGRWYALKVLH